jgi:hypothetical protein
MQQYVDLYHRLIKQSEHYEKDIIFALFPIPFSLADGPGPTN